MCSSPFWALCICYHYSEPFLFVIILNFHSSFIRLCISQLFLITKRLSGAYNRCSVLINVYVVGLIMCMRFSWLEESQLDVALSQGLSSSLFWLSYHLMTNGLSDRSQKFPKEKQKHLIPYICRFPMVPIIILTSYWPKSQVTWPSLNSMAWEVCSTHKGWRGQRVTICCTITYFRRILLFLFFKVQKLKLRGIKKHSQSCTSKKC